MFGDLDLIQPGEPLDGPMQMALDEVLLSRVDRPTLRFYRWSAPWVTFGYFQEEVTVRNFMPHLPRVRRWTGGGMVAHGEDLTFSLLLPQGDPVAMIPAAEFYRRLHTLVAQAFVAVFGEGVSLAGPGDVLAGEACFSAPAKDDLIFLGKKLLGGAQRRRGGALLYQGSLQSPSVGRIDPLDLARLLGERVRSGDEIASEVISASHELVSVKYGTEVWNRRR